MLITQAVDLDDKVLGFFHRWLEVFSTRFESIEVVCLKEGKHALPANIRVYSLGKEGGRSRLKYLWRFYRYIWLLRGKYDAVFVHMNEEYVLLGGLFWRLMRKKIILWRNFRYGSWQTPIAARLAQHVCYTSAESFTRRYANSVQMPIGIDTDLFAPPLQPPAGNSILFFGRLDEIKKPHVFLDALRLLHVQGISYAAHIYGDPTSGNEAYADSLREKYGTDPGVTFYSGTTNRGSVEIYQSHALYVNLTLPGSFDKTIGEAMASGCLVVCPNGAVASALPPEGFVTVTPESAAHGMASVLTMTESDRAQAREKGRNYIVREHSLDLLAERLHAILGDNEHN